MTAEEALTLAEETLDAYSVYNYTESGWRACHLMLARRGYGAYAVEEIVRSKWTRWACDFCEVERHWSAGGGWVGRHTSACLARFLDSGSQGKSITPENWAGHMYR